MSRRRVPRRIGAAAVVLIGVLMAGCTSAADPRPTPPPVDTSGPRAAFVDAPAGASVVIDGDDWSLPPWVRPAANSGFFSEEASEEHRVLVRSVDLTWRQLQPRRDAAIDRAASGSAQQLEFASLHDQLADPGAFWMRLFASGADWAPEWIVDECGVSTYGPDYDGMEHLPIWDECVWGHLLDTYRRVFVDEGLAADPRLRFVYVPGAFTWAEFDYDIVSAAVETGDLDEEAYLAWYSHAWTDLVELFGDQAHKLVFTGEDYPFGPFGAADDLLARDAVDAGMGIRTGITELANFHLSEAPAYGSAIQPDGHLVVDESLPVHSGRFVVATENECYTDCGYETDEPYYAVRQSNLKALQLRTNWIYVVPGPSYFDEYPEHWDWVRLSQGQRPETSADAWAAFRDAEDTYWRDEAGERFADPAAWVDRPWVRNLERWLVQRDEPGSVAHRTEVDAHVETLEPDNGTAFEGLSTAVAEGDTGFVLEVDERFAAAAGDRRLVAKVTFLDTGRGGFSLDTASGGSPVIERANTGGWRTATVTLPGLGGTARFRIALEQGADDLVIRFVRLVRAEG